MNQPPLLPPHENQEVARYRAAWMPAPYPGPVAAPRDILVSIEEDSVNQLLERWSVIWRQKWILLAALASGGAAALVVSLCQAPVFRAATTLEIRSVQEPFSDAGLVGGGDPFIHTQAEFLSSRTLADRVVEKLRRKPLPAEEPNDRLASLRKLLRWPSPYRSLTRESALAAAAESVRVTTLKGSRIVTIQCDSTHPDVAADFANALVREHVELNMEQRWDSYQNTGGWLARAQEDLKEKLRESEQKLDSFARQSGLVFTTENRSLDEEALKQLQAQLTAARADRIGRQSVYESSRSGQPEALPEVLDSGPMRQYQVQISQLMQERAELSANLTPAHPRLKRVEAQIRELETVQKKERTNILRRIRIEYEAALKRERQLAAEYNSLAQQLASHADERTHYQTLVREVEIHRQLYETALQKAKEAGVASALNTSSIHVVDRARVPRSSSSPNLLTSIPLGFFAGAALGVLLILVRERSNVSIQGPGSLPAGLNVRELGVIPAARTDRDSRRLDRRPGRLLDSDSGADAAERLALVSWTCKPSMMAEAFRTTMASILFSGDNGSVLKRVILFTSPSAGDGKSTVVSNLGIALAEINYRVVLIDSDMRRPRLHLVFNVANSWGLSDLLYDRIPVEDYPREALVRKTDIPGLHLIPSGPARVSISSLLYSPRLEDLLRRLSLEFDIVLIDTSPVLTVSDARIIGRVADAVVLVLRAGHTSRDAATAAVRCFEEDGTAVLGTVLNDWTPNTGYTSLKYSRYA